MKIKWCSCQAEDTLVDGVLFTLNRSSLMICSIDFNEIIINMHKYTYAYKLYTKRHENETTLCLDDTIGEPRVS